MSNTKEEPFLLSPYQMAEVERLTEELEDIHATVKKRNNQIENVLGAFNEPIEETRKYVYHVSGFKLKAMFDILFGKGLKWGNREDKGIFYNATEYLNYMDAYGIFKLGKTTYQKHVSYFHMVSFYLCDKLRGITTDETGIPFWCSKGQYKRRYGYIPLNVTYEIDTRGFEEGKKVYEDPTHVTVGRGSISASDGLPGFARYIPQERISSKYIRLKAISFVFPWLYPIFGDYGFIHKVLWRRK